MADSMQRHIDEDAELYALGALSETERVAVERHIAQCALCLQRVREAEETVFILTGEHQAVTPPRALNARIAHTFAQRTPPRAWMAIAAAFIIGILPTIPLTIEHVRHDQIDRMHDEAFLAMLNSHFVHAQFAALNGAALPPAKVIFSRNGSWLYVVVSGAHTYDVKGVSVNGTELLGQTQARAATSELFIARPPHVRAIVLTENGIPVGQASVVVTSKSR